MKSIILAKSGLNKIKAHHQELKAVDFDGSIRGLTPGEWCIFSHPSSTESWIGFINPLLDEKFSCAQVLEQCNKTDEKSFSPEGYITKVIVKAVARRAEFKGYTQGSRLFYGSADGLPGLIIDGFKEVAVIQINTAGVDRYRDFIGTSLQKVAGKRPYFLDNPKYREKESLPVFETSQPPVIDIAEGDLIFRIRPEVMQKVGFYYDHRENRLSLRHLLGRMNRKFETGLDLFSYAGAWGVSALAGGVNFVDFVDQGDFDPEITSTLDLNGHSGKGKFHRTDVFKYLDAQIANNKKFDVILCDPPAFAKSASQKEQALEGYSKLHRKVMKLAGPRSLVVFSSCTHYVGHEEFQKNVADAAFKEGRGLQLLHSGIQGWDHPVSSLSERGNYIKSYFYLTE